jgi:hypothetical protein
MFANAKLLKKVLFLIEIKKIAINTWFPATNDFRLSFNQLKIRLL